MNNMLLNTETNLYYIKQYFATTPISEIEKTASDYFGSRRNGYIERATTITKWLEKWTNESAIVEEFQKRPEILQMLLKIAYPEESFQIEQRQRKAIAMYKNFVLTAARTKGSHMVEMCEQIFLPTLPIKISNQDFWANEYRSPLHTMARIFSHDLDSRPFKEFAFSPQYFRVIDTTKKIDDIVQNNTTTCYAMYAHVYFHHPIINGSDLAPMDTCLQWCNDHPLDAQLYAEALEKDNKPVPLFLILWKMKQPAMALSPALSMLNIPDVHKIISGEYASELFGVDNTHAEKQKAVDQYIEYVKSIEQILLALGSKAPSSVLQTDDLFNEINAP